MKQDHPAEPTGDQCSQGARVEDFNGSPAYACWYPQMGGYVGRCVIVFDPPEEGNFQDNVDYCFDAYIWHDGQFPFPEADEYGDQRGPVSIHHCSPDQFVGFGQFVLNKQQEHAKEKPDEGPDHRYGNQDTDEGPSDR